VFVTKRPRHPENLSSARPDPTPDDPASEHRRRRQGSGPQDQNFDEGRVIARKNRPELSRRLLDLARESIVIRTGEMAPAMLGVKAMHGIRVMGLGGWVLAKS